MAESINTVAQQGFSRSGKLYEDGRAGYPPEAIELLVQSLRVTKTSVVADLAAGTGKFSKQIHPYVGKLTAVEPVAEMRKRFSVENPSIEVVEGTAEKMPFGAESLDSVFVATAFHWFNFDEAAREIHRTLKPGAGLGLIWNFWNQNKKPQWLQEIRAVCDPYTGNTPRYRYMEWRKPFDAPESLFTPLQTKSFDHPQLLTPEQVCNRMLSVSFIAALPQAEFESVHKRMQEILARYADAAVNGLFEMPYQTDVYWCFKK